MNKWQTGLTILVLPIFLGNVLHLVASSTVHSPAGQSSPKNTEPLLALVGLTKRFPGVLALDSVGFELRRGEVHAICGENGAGKSTLMKVLSGLYQPDEGTIVFKGEARRFATPLQAQAAGIAMIHQELNLVPHLSVAENIYLAREPRKGWFVDRERLRADAQRCLDRLGVHISPSATVSSLSVAQQQMVEIAKALSLDAEVLIMDEPTSSLTESETSQLFKVILELRAAGVGIVYISHRLDEMVGSGDLGTDDCGLCVDHTGGCNEVGRAYHPNHSCGCFGLHILEPD